MLETNTAGDVSADQRYRAYGRQRASGPVVTDHRFTGQKYDGTGLYYYNARYYDPALGAFISPDTIVPDPTNLLDYNRYSYVRGNPLKYNDPSGHCGTLAVTGGTSAPLDVACWIAMAEAAAAVAAVGTGAVGAGAFLAAGLYGYEQTTFDLPDYDHAYDIPGTDLQASSIVNGSSTVRSGVPVIETDVEGFTLLDPPQLEELVVVSFPSDPTSSLKRRNSAYWKKLGLDAHELKSDVPGKLSEFDLYEDAEGYIWALRKNHRGADPHYIGHLDELIEELDN